MSETLTSTYHTCGCIEVTGPGVKHCPYRCQEHRPTTEDEGGDADGGRTGIPGRQKPDATPPGPAMSEQEAGSGEPVAWEWKCSMPGHATEGNRLLGRGPVEWCCGAEVEWCRPLAPVVDSGDPVRHRINIEDVEGGVHICRGDHDRSAGCEWEFYATPTVPGPEPEATAYEQELDRRLAAFADDLRERQTMIEPEVKKLLYEHLWDLYDVVEAEPEEGEDVEALAKLDRIVEAAVRWCPDTDGEAINQLCSYADDLRAALTRSQVADHE